MDLIKNVDQNIYLEVLDNIKMALKRKQLEFTELKKDDYILLKPGCYLKGRLIAHKKCKNRVISIPAIVIKDYTGGLIGLKPSVDIYNLDSNKEYFTTPDCLTVIDKKQHDILLQQFVKRANKDEIKFSLKKKEK